MSTIKQLIKQQLGFSKWKNYDNVMERLRCVDTEEFKHIYTNEERGENTVDSPIFACKFAQKQGQEHILALANEDGKVALHDTMNKEPRIGKRIHHNAIFDLAWMFNQMKLVTVSGDHTARLVNISEGELRVERMFSGHTRSVKTLAIKQNDSSVFATGGRDGNILIWDTRSVTNVAFITYPDRSIENAHYLKHTTPSKRKYYHRYMPSISGANSVTGLVFQNENTLVSCSAGEGSIKLWDLRKTYKINRIKEPSPKFIIPYSGSTAKCGFSNLIIDKEFVKLYANCLDNTIYCYNVSNCDPKPIKVYNGHQNNTFYVKSCLSSDGNYLLSGSSDHNSYIWNTDYSEPIVKLTGHTAEVTCVAWYQDCESALVTCSDDYRHKIWRIGAEALPDNWEIHGRGLAEKLISKRCLDHIHTIPKIKKLKVCSYCDFYTDKHCENCNSNSDKPKRLATDDVECYSKRLHIANTPKKSYRHELQILNEEEIDVPSKRIKLNIGESSCLFNDHVVPETKEILKTPKSVLHIEEEISPEPFSPTTNLPNFNVDGSAPHLNYSPQKRTDKDWLTKMRIERNIMREMRELTNSPTPPKLMKMENSSPKNGKRLNKLNRCGTQQSPLLKFFRMTNNNIMKDSNQCVTKLSVAESPKLN